MKNGKDKKSPNEILRQIIFLIAIPVVVTAVITFLGEPLIQFISDLNGNNVGGTPEPKNNQPPKDNEILQYIDKKVNEEIDENISDKIRSNVETEVNEVREDSIANEMSYMNFLLAVFGLLATLSGIAFTLYNYFQVNTVRKQVKEGIEEGLDLYKKKVDDQFQKMKSEMDERFEQQKEEMQKTVNKAIEAIQILTEHSVAITNGDFVGRKLKQISMAEKIYPGIRGDYLRALIYWYEGVSENTRRYAITYMEKHLDKYPDHKEAWIRLIDWYNDMNEDYRAIHTLETLLKKFPDAFEEIELAIDNWDLPEELEKERKRIYDTYLRKKDQSEQDKPKE
ncbi:tetratricopeptide repeat protein [Lihuaxuella thermophila]|uniref:Tetratricopeptide repeat-containing protein n=1 Tax=Lihuaxuella thermophila TaxID=1173111 RepID=A0A1H8CPM2_9BACL|nr:hypothetical protein [Lihuaxuella thermophila]SEM96849.1 hypothetical protein SAMN05444955_10438 [Lihuaxuella thermophila]